ncbi:MAG: M50 family metallopeptidase [Melioribacter sp.]|nr:M50 family metallopeptidase [Melioribacter sp.]
MRNIDYKELFITTSIIFLCLLIWDTKLLFPLKLLVTLLHEISHAIACILTGGRVLEIDINSELGGKCLSEDGNTFIISIAGYFGSFLFGVSIFYSSYKTNIKAPLLIFLLIIILLFSANILNNKFLGFITILIVISLLLIVKLIPGIISNYILRIIGLISCIYVLFDMKSDIFSKNYYLSDVSTIAELSGIPYYVWGIIWLIVTISGLLFLIVKVHKK